MHLARTLNIKIHCFGHGCTHWPVTEIFINNRSARNTEFRIGVSSGGHAETSNGSAGKGLGDW